MIKINEIEINDCVVIKLDPFNKEIVNIEISENEITLAAEIEVVKVKTGEETYSTEIKISVYDRKYNFKLDHESKNVLLLPPVV